MRKRLGFIALALLVCLVLLPCWAAAESDWVIDVMEGMQAELEAFVYAYDDWDLVTDYGRTPVPADGDLLLLRIRRLSEETDIGWVANMIECGEATLQANGEVLSLVDIREAGEDALDFVFAAVEDVSREECVFDYVGVVYELAELPDSAVNLNPTPTPVVTAEPTPEPTEEPTEEADGYTEVNALFQRFLDGELTTVEGDARYGKKLMIAVYSYTTVTEPPLLTEEDVELPGFELTQDFAEADTVVFLYPEYEYVGSYSNGGAANRTNTMIAVVDPKQGTVYAPFQGASHEPPSTITVTVINGVPTVSGANGSFDWEEALYELQISVATAEPLEVSEDAEDSQEAQAPATELTGTDAQELLNALDDAAYGELYEYIASGEVIGKGSKGDMAKVLQQMLCDMGQDISVDGSVGKKTLEAVNAVLGAFGYAETETVDGQVFEELLVCALYCWDMDAASDVLYAQLEPGQDDYLRGCACYAQEKYYTAKQYFEESEYGDWAARAGACVREWPDNGTLLKNVSGSATKLTLKVNGNEDGAYLFKIYTEDEEESLAACLFVGGSGKASVKLPAGTYVIKEGYGENWYGLEDAFGERPEGIYTTMTFEDGSTQVELARNREYTITINVQDDMTGDYVGSEYEDYETF